MQGKPLRIAMEPWIAVPEECLQDALCPFGIGYVRAARDLADHPGIVDTAVCLRSTAVLAHVGLVAAVLVSVELRCHITAASPVFISDTEEVHFPGLRVSILCTKICHRGNAFKGHVLNPFRHLLYSTAAQVAVHIGFAPQLPAQLHVLVRTKAVVLYHAAPVGVDHLLAVFFRADPVFPVILVSKTAAGPAQDRNPDLFQGFHNVCAHAIDIRDIGILTDIHSFIDTASQVLGEVSVDLFVDLPHLLRCIDIILSHTVAVSSLLSLGSASV